MLKCTCERSGSEGDLDIFYGKGQSMMNISLGVGKR